MTFKKVTFIDPKSVAHDPSKAWQSTDLVAINDGMLRLRSMRNTEAQWHKHAGSDEFFMLVSGSFEMDFRDHLGAETTYQLAPGQMLVVHAGTEHRARVQESAELLVFDAISNP
ncbi:cupin domain-containing protein [Sinorhizobium fredii]|uniref:cupin domain-containing protein n=1 Tax=Rhizobium fredii TaxID=380 RepID=UPI000688D5FE|nr:cupin domain-containing protein [Sinorhizobium fredii]ASY74401.1 hypothetical protein SF83666_d70160 [Sinorhizobium fredii CCBAU 83666]